MADVDASIVIGSMPDEASAKKTGEALGRAAGAAANSAFLASFNAIFDKIPVSNKPVKGSVSMPTKAREHLNQLLGVAGSAPLGSAESNAALKHLISALREYDRKGKLGVDTQLAVTSAISQGQDVIRIGNRVQRQGENAAFAQDKLRAAYQSAVTDFRVAQLQLQLAEKSGDAVDIQYARSKYLRSAKYLTSRRFASVADPLETRKADEAQKDYLRELRKNTQAMLFLNTSVAAIGAGAQIATALATSFMQQHVDRNVFASAGAYASRVKATGSIGGTVAGTLLGGVLGGFLGAGGAIIGANVGGTVFGAAGGLPGEALSKNLQGKQKTIADMQARIRANNMYRGRYSVSFGNMVQEMGMATAGDVENMVGNSQTLAARMMFGQVGENEMLMYSLMPNYFAAAMNGASDVELAQAYANDLKALPPMFRLWAGSSVGGGSAGMAAFAQDSFFGSVMGNASKAHWLDQMMVAYSGGWQGGSVDRGLVNAELGMAEAMNATAVAKNEVGIYNAATGLRPVFAHTGPAYGSKIIANSYDLQKAVAAGQMAQGDYETIFQNTGYLFNAVTQALNKRTPEDWAKAQADIYGRWGPNESRDIVVQIYMDNNKQEEVRVRGEQAAKAGKMSVYSSI